MVSQMRIVLRVYCWETNKWWWWRRVWCDCETVVLRIVCVHTT